MGETTETQQFVLARSPGHLLHRAQQRAEEVFATLLGNDHVTLRQFTVLAAADAVAGLSQTDLVRLTGVDRSTLADMMKRLEKKGLITREKSDEDKRAKTVRLTSKGRARMTETAPYALAADAALIEALPKNKRRAFLGTLQALVETIDNVADVDTRKVTLEGRRNKKKGKKTKGEKDRAQSKPKR